MAYLKAAIAITYYLGCIFKVINVDCNFFSNGMIRIVARFLLTSASRSPSAIAELLVQINIAGSVDQKYTCIGIPQAVLMNASTAIGLYVGLIAILKQVPTTMSPSTDCSNRIHQVASPPDTRSFIGLTQHKSIPSDPERHLDRFCRFCSAAMNE